MDVPHKLRDALVDRMNVLENTNNTNGRSQQYMYVVDAMDIYHPQGYDMMPLKEHPLTFQAPAHRAAGYLFGRGYNLVSEEGLFEDNGLPFLSEMFETTSSANSTEDYVPDRLSVLMPIRHPYARLYPQARFKKLHVQRYIVPKQQGGGNRKRTKSAKRRVGSRRTSRSRSRRS